MADSAAMIWRCHLGVVSGAILVKRASACLNDQHADAQLPDGFMRPGSRYTGSLRLGAAERPLRDVKHTFPTTAITCLAAVLAKGKP
jgi:hypothetical protein